MNIFETIGRVSRRYEPYHSQFLTDALESSLKCDRSLIDDVWKLAAPPDWEPPEQAAVSAEEVVESGRIDVCIRSDHPNRRVVGIEVKTDDASAHSGQLEKYRTGLMKKFRGYDVQISYLTPFNREHAGEAADSLTTVRVFEEFASDSTRSRHLSWLDVADIPWDGNHLWKQHQAYVHQHISSRKELQKRSALNRGFAEFFGREAADRFLEEIGLLGVRDTEINFSEFRDVPSFARSLADAFGILLGTANVSRNVRRDDKFPDELRRRFLESQYCEAHVAMFDLSRRFPHVWVQGKRDYGVRTAHRKYSSGVSLLRSDGPERLVVGERR